MAFRGMCRLCRVEKDLIKAHIIPRSLLGKVLDDRNPKVYSVDPKDWPKRTPTGVYDPRILCAECDGRLGVWDNYAKEFLDVPITEYGEIPAILRAGFYDVPVSDYTKLKLFFMSVLWRAHLTAHEFFGAVDLGPYERSLHEMIKDSEPGPESEFAVNMGRYFVSNEKYDGLQFLLPAPVRSSGANLNYYKFRIADYVALIKVDKRLFHEELRRFTISPNRRLHVALFDYLESEEFDYVTKTKGAWRVTTASRGRRGRLL